MNKGFGWAGVSGERIMARLEELAAISEDADGLTRVFLSPEHKRAGELLIRWMKAAGMAASFDAIGNVVGRLEGDRNGLRALMMGSHIDTVRNAGHYDGALGVVAAIECVEALRRDGVRPPFAVEVVGFADEEGVRFRSTLLGSRAVAGTFDPALLDRRDADGVTMAEALRRFGLDPGAIPRVARRPEDVHAFVELHIEQGPVLEAEDLPVGVVTAIAGATRFHVSVGGEGRHAGTPMHLRRDALAAAAEMVVAVEARCRRGGEAGLELLGTVGELSVPGGAANVVAGVARFTIDVRSGKDATRADAVGDIVRDIRLVAARRGVRVEIAKTHEADACPCAPWLMERLADAVRSAAVRPLRLQSSAGHDAMALAALTDVAMLFVRCAGGISHHSDESITGDDAAMGARVLLNFVRNFEPNASEGRR